MLRQMRVDLSHVSPVHNLHLMVVSLSNLEIIEENRSVIILTKIDIFLKYLL